jgi:very-short-patch-repair endonuclease
MHGVPTPVPEHTVLDALGQFIGRVDFAYPELRYAIEVDGYESHSGLREFRHDRIRQNDLVDLGWTLHRFTWSEVDQLSGRVADRIRRQHRQLLGTLDRARSG